MRLLSFVFFLFATASASPLSGTQRSRCEHSAGSYINITTSPFDRITNLRVTTPDFVYSTPGTIMVGTADKVLRCLQEDPDECEVFYSSSSRVNSLVVTGEYYYIGLHNGNILKCNLDRKESCEEFLMGNSMVQSLASASGNLYAGLNNGTLLCCRLHEPNSCRHFQNQEDGTDGFLSLTQFHEYIYAGVGHKLMQCALSDEICTQVITMGGNVEGLTIMGNSIFAVTWDGSIFKCSLMAAYGDTATRCEGLPLNQNNPEDVAFHNDELYTVATSEGIFRCMWADETYCTSYGNFEKPYTLVFVYGVFKMQIRYKDEDTKCIMQSQAKCPPTVIYYDAQQRALLEVRVINGKLHDAFGKIVDTSDADVGSSGPAAIFAMAPDGRIMLSKKHVPGLLHTSSLVGGNPVSGAGEMVVKNGVIEKMTACSDHYQPDLNLNRQVIQSLRAQGYIDHIDSLMCDENDGDEFQVFNQLNQIICNV